MTPKETSQELLTKYNGDPLAAADDYFDAIFAISGDVGAFVAHTISNLGEDGAEKWGRVLVVIIAYLLEGRPINVFSSDFALLRDTRIEPTVTGADVTRIAKVKNQPPDLTAGEFNRGE